MSGNQRDPSVGSLLNLYLRMMYARSERCTEYLLFLLLNVLKVLVKVAHAIAFAVAPLEELLIGRLGGLPVAALPECLLSRLVNDSLVHGFTHAQNVRQSLP